MKQEATRCAAPGGTGARRDFFPVWHLADPSSGDSEWTAMARKQRKNLPAKCGRTELWMEHGGGDRTAAPM